MTVPGNLSSPLLATAAAATAVSGVRSLRFNTGDSAYLSRTPSSAGNRRTWTWSGWVKRNNIATGNNQEHALFVTSDSGGNSDYVTLYFNSSGYLNTTAFQSGSVQWSVKTARVFRDPGAWMHIVWAVDLSQSTASDRVKLYCNGSRITDFITETYPSSAFDTRMNSTNEHSIGRASLYDRWYASFQLADIYFVDGLQLTPTSFGSTDSNGVWQRGTYSGTYGTNGFHLLDFENESTIGDDSSGNSNDFTANNLSDTAGAGNDVLLDFPANGSESDTGAGGQVSGNYAVLNPLNKHTSNNSFSNGNLEFTTSGSDGGLTESTIAVSSGKFYFEVVYSRSDQGQFAGIRKPGSRNYNNSYIYVGTGNKYTNGGSGASYGATLAHGDVIGTAFDADNGTLEFFKNGTSQGTAFTGISGTYAFFVGSFGGAPTGIVNFGARPFSYAAPSGFKALNTANLSTPTIADGSDHFETSLWTVPSGSANTTISGLSFAPDWLLTKNRSHNYEGSVYDTVRGDDKYLKLFSGSGTAAETTAATRVNLTSDGFVLEADNDNSNYNAGSASVGWAWNAGTSTASNTSGNITSSVRVNQTAGFSIVGFNLSVTNTEKSIGHGLSTAPTFYVIKNRSSSDNWYAYTTAVDGTLDFKYLNTNDAFSASSRTLPTSSVFYFASSTTGNHIAYCFAPVAGYSAFGSYTGNTSITPFVYTGMRPRWIMVKASSATGNWTIHDTARETYNASDSVLYPNVADAEYSNSGMAVDILSNGFKLRTTTSSYQNSSGVTYIYAAFAENPFQANGGLAR